VGSAEATIIAPGALLSGVGFYVALGIFALSLVRMRLMARRPCRGRDGRRPPRPLAMRSPLRSSARICSRRRASAENPGRSGAMSDRNDNAKRRPVPVSSRERTGNDGKRWDDPPIRRWDMGSGVA
jgi:hypothetical protein